MGLRSKSIYLLFIFLILSIGSSSQINESKYVSSLKEKIKKENSEQDRLEALLELYKIESEYDIQHAKNYLDQGIILAQNLNDRDKQATISLMYGDYFMVIGHYDLAQDFVNKAIDEFKDLGNTLGVASCLNTMGSISLQQGDYESSIKHFIEAAEIYQEEGNIQNLLIVYHNLGGIHFELNRYDKAEFYWDKCYEGSLNIKDTIGIVLSLNGLGALNEAKGEFRSGIHFMSRSLKYAEGSNLPSYAAFITMNLGSLYERNDQLDSAKIFYEYSKSLYSRLSDPYNETLLYYNLGELADEQGNYQLALQFYDSSLQMADSLKSPKLLEYSYSGMSDANKHAGNFEEAFLWLDRLHTIQDSITNENVQTNLAELQEKYESELKDAEIADLEKKEIKALLQAQKSKTQLVIVVAVCSLFVILLFMYLGIRKVKERHRRIKLEQKALRSQMNPHFIFNSLGAIQELYMSGEFDLANNYMGDFGNLMRRILDYSDKELISLKEEIEMLQLYLDLEKSRNSELIEYEIEIDQRIDLIGTKIPPLIVQPFVENAIWHGILPSNARGLIKIKFSVETNSNKIDVEIADNGIGFDKSRSNGKHESKGISITEQRLKTKVKITDLNPGTKISFSISL